MTLIRALERSYLIKVNYFRKDFLESFFAPKNERKYFCISALASKKRPNQKNKGRALCATN